VVAGRWEWLEVFLDDDGVPAAVGRYRVADWRDYPRGRAQDGAP
jgi:hypothetical protein